MSISLFILLANVLVSISALYNRDLFYKLDFQPYLIEEKKQWYRFVSHAFVHANWPHLIVNMWVLYLLGKDVEIGFRVQFGAQWIPYYLMLYFGGLLFSTIPGYARNRGNYHYHAVGASGAVSAIVFAYILLWPTSKLGFFFLPSMPAIVFGAIYLALEIYMDRNRNSNIAHSAHYFGAIFGVVFTLALKPSLALGIWEWIQSF